MKVFCTRKRGRIEILGLVNIEINQCKTICGVSQFFVFVNGRTDVKTPFDPNPRIATLPGFFPGFTN